MSEAAVQVQLVLISHTNAGKTTLARTLTGMDVGEVRDAPHVTLFSESHTLLTSASGDALQLWDTPGFGDSQRLFKRLSMSANPIGWLLREVVDRYRDPPFWLNQQALRTAREAADVVLYLVNASENPEDAGYLVPEMQILAWLDKPVIVLLNQLGPPRPHASENSERMRWEDHLRPYPVVRSVLTMDAFARCWVHERVLYEAIGKVLPEDKHTGFARIQASWEEANRSRFAAAMDRIATQLLDAACDREHVETEGASLSTMLSGLIGGKQRQQKRQEKAMGQMMQRLNDGIQACTRDLLALHKLDPGASATIHERVNQHFTARTPVDTRQAGMIGALLTGAATGLSADLMAGGLTFGAGALVGGILGVMGFAGAAWAFNASTDRSVPSVEFSDEFLYSLVTTGLLRYLAIAHFGRGRGNFTQGEAAPFWQQEVEAALASHKEVLEQLWQSARSSDAHVSRQHLSQHLREAGTQVLKALYPQASVH